MLACQRSPRSVPLPLVIALVFACGCGLTIAQESSEKLVRRLDELAACPSPGRTKALIAAQQLMTPLSSIPLREASTSNAPEDYAAATFLAGTPHEYPTLSRDWQYAPKHWTATALWHPPLYFEDVNLERHGLSFGLAQPAVSAAHFVGNVITLPYHMVRQHPHECVYDLGHFRPGNCVAFYCQHAPLDAVAGLAEAGTIIGLVLLIP